MLKHLKITILLVACAIMANGCKKQQHEVSLQADEPSLADTSNIPSRSADDIAPAPPADWDESVDIKPEPTQDNYSVKKGDTLWSIAKKVYGDGQRWKDIVKANPGLDPQKLYVGQKLNMPPK